MEELNMRSWGGGRALALLGHLGLGVSSVGYPSQLPNELSKTQI